MNLQQHLLRALVERIQFCVVDFLLAEIEDVITDGIRMHLSFPYAHFISHMLSRIAYDPQRPPPHFTLFQDTIRSYYKIYKASAQSMRPVRDAPPKRQPTQTGDDAAVEEESEDDSTDSDDERPWPPTPLAHDSEVGGSRDPPPPHPSPQVTAA